MRRGLKLVLSRQRNAHGLGPGQDRCTVVVVVGRRDDRDPAELQDPRDQVDHLGGAVPGEHLSSRNSQALCQEPGDGIPFQRRIAIDAFDQVGPAPADDVRKPEGVHIDTEVHHRSGRYRESGELPIRLTTVIVMKMASGKRDFLFIIHGEPSKGQFYLCPRIPQACCGAIPLETRPKGPASYTRGFPHGASSTGGKAGRFPGAHSGSLGGRP